MNNFSDWFFGVSGARTMQPAFVYCKFLLVGFILLNSTGIIWGQPPWLYVHGRLIIEGESNFGRFNLKADISQKCRLDSINRVVYLNLPIEIFRGNLPGMERDFRKILRSSEYPEIIVRIPVQSQGGINNAHDPQAIISGRCLKFDPLSYRKNEAQDFIVEKVISLQGLGLYHGEKIRGFITLKPN